MTPAEYQRLAGRTDPLDGYADPKGIGGRVANPEHARILHYLLGIHTEGAELADAAKRAIVYGAELDRVNAIEEIGDLLWYVARLLDLLGSSFDEAMARNIAKLRARYPNGFREADALERDLETEHRTLEGSMISTYCPQCGHLENVWACDELVGTACPACGLGALKPTGHY